MGETVPATEFKARCLELMDRVAEGRETYVITKHGRAVAKLVPADPPEERDVFGCMVDLTKTIGSLDLGAADETPSPTHEAESAAQWKAWEREWRQKGTVSGRKPPVPKTRKPGRAGR